MRKLIFSLLFVSLFLAACNFTLAADVTPPPGYQQQPVAAAPVGTPSGLLFPLIPPNPAAGKAIYSEKCAPCHGEKGLGDGPLAMQLPYPVTAIGTAELARQTPPSKWFDVVTNGNMERRMPPFASLNDRQRWDVVAYVYSLSNPQETIIQGAELYRQYCAQCHGSEGKGDGEQAKGLTLPNFTSQEYAASRTSEGFFKTISDGVSPGMPAYADKLDEGERWALTSYIRSLGFASAVAEAPNTTPESETPPSPTEAFIASDDKPIDEPSQLGSIGGEVINASGGGVPAGEDVMLHTFDQMQLVYTATTQIQQDGTYSFEGVKIEPGLSYLSTIDYDGVVYGSEVVTADEPEKSLELPIELYDSTTDNSLLSVDRLHYFFEFLDEKTVRVVELFIISNPTEKTVISTGEGQPVVSFPIPASAAQLEFQDGELGGRYVKTEDGFGDTLPVRPGSGAYQLLYSYQMPYDRKLEFTRQMPLDTQAVVILVPEESVKVKGVNIQDAGMRDVQGVQYHMYNGESLPKGGNLSLTITGRPLAENAPSAISSNSDLVIGLGALGVVLILVGAWMYQRSRQGEKPPASSRTQEPVMEENPETIMDAILALDDLFQDGKLPEDAYLKRRAELKARLKQLMAQQD